MKQGRRSWLGATRSGALAVGSLALSACRVEWEGGSIAIEDPAPEPETVETVEALEPEQVELPHGPHLYFVGLGADGSARVVPLARIEPIGAPAPLTASLMSEEDPTFRDRFDSTFLAAGAQLDLVARGGRIGSVILHSVTGGDGACASIASAQAILPPGQDVPAWAFAAPAGTLPVGGLRRIGLLAATSSMAIAGPVLAERLIGGDRAYLARRQAMMPVELTGDTLTGMTATYLIADSLSPGPPGPQAVSLFFMARFEPSRGFIPVWEEVRRYGTAEDKESFEYFDWIMLPAGRLDLLRRFDASSLRLAAGLSASDGERSIVWVEDPSCPVLERLGG